MEDALSASLAQISDLSRGFRRAEDGHTLQCLHCACSFDEELVYPEAELFYTAQRSMKRHMDAAHGGSLEALLAMGRERTGLTETQEILIRAFASGKDDRNTAAELGGRSESTVRNHRFQLRRRESEAKILIALLALVSERETPSARLVSYPVDLPVKDERTDVTEEEAAAIERRYLDSSRRPAMPRFPKRQKEKLVLLKRIAAAFESAKTYSEPEVNEILMPFHDDYVTIRRYLIEYRFLEREPDGSAYRKR